MAEHRPRPDEDLVRRVAAALDVVPHGAVVVVATSGGPDSTGLLYLVCCARHDVRVVVGHIRHGLRDDAADAAVAAAHAGALALPYHERQVTVRPGGDGPEATARAARYQALGSIAAAVGGRWLLTGHTADDQAETTMLHLLRGSGLAGVAGMRATRSAGDVTILRPLLSVRRAQVRQFVAAAGLRTAIDPTNADRAQPRAYIRHEVLPQLAGLPGTPRDPVVALTRFARLARDDAEALDRLAAEQARAVVVAWGSARAVRVDALVSLPRALASRVLRSMLADVRGGMTGLSARAVSDVLELRPGKAVHVAGGVWVTSGGGWLAAAPDELQDLDERTLPNPGAAAIPELEAVLRVGPRSEAGPGSGATSEVLVPPATRHPISGRGSLTAQVRLPLRVRARREGDRIQLTGGRRKLHDLFVDLGVPRALRGLVPVVVDADDEPVWLPGLACRAGKPAGDPIRLALLTDGRDG